MNRRLREESIWIVATAVAVVGVQLLAHEAPGFPFGSDWGQYLQGADALWRADNAAPYPSWRGPLYMFLLGGPGQKLGYVVAGRLVSRIAAALCVIAAALAARALTGRSMAAVVPLMVATFAPLQQAAVWVNPYATLGAVQGLCLAAGLASVRWGWRWAAVACGLLAAAAVATDPRGWMMVPIAALLGLLAPAAGPGVARRRWLSPVLLLSAMALGLTLTLFIQRDLPHTPLGQAIQEQHVLSAEMVGMKTGPDHPLAACLSEDSTSGHMVTTPACARHLLAWNQGRMVPRGYTPPLWSLLALPLLLIPAAWGRRSAVAALAGVGLPVLAMAAGLAWVEWAPRYSAPYAVPLALLGPIAIARLLPWARGTRWSWLVILALGAWVWWAVPSHRASQDHDPSLPGEGDLLDFARWLDAEAGAGGLVLNCSQQPVDILLLPRPMLASYPIAGNADRCQAWASTPTQADGRLLFLSVHDPYTGACMGECAGIEPAELGWTEIPLPASAPPGVRGWER
jgi:hypothetical protein